MNVNQATPYPELVAPMAADSTDRFFAITQGSIATSKRTEDAFLNAPVIEPRTRRH
jgi:hypothetical protein